MDTRRATRVAMSYSTRLQESAKMDQLFRQLSLTGDGLAEPESPSLRWERIAQMCIAQGRRVPRQPPRSKATVRPAAKMAEKTRRIEKKALYTVGEVVLIRSFGEDEQHDYKPEVRGHEHVAIVEECSAHEVTVRLLHRDPDGLAARRPDIVCHDEDVPLVRRGRDHLTIKVALRDVIKVDPGSVQIAVRKATFRGYTEQFLSTCGGAQIAGMYNAYHQLEAPHRNRTVDVRVWDTPPADCRQHPKARRALKFPESGIRKGAWDGSAKASWTGKRAADTWHGLELLSSSVDKARKAAIVDEDDPRTWRCGNGDIARALHKIGIQTDVVASQPAAPKAYRERDANGKNVWAKNQQEEAKAWIWQQVKQRFADGPMMFHIYTQSAGYQKANPHPKDSQYRGGGDGHYTLVFAWAEGVTSDGVHFRRVLTARNYQAPRHWVDVHDIWDQMRWGGTEFRVAPLKGSRFGGAPAILAVAQNQRPTICGPGRAAKEKKLKNCGGGKENQESKERRWR